MLHSLLWQLNSEIRRGCLEHPFVRGLADGTLEGEVFKRYVAQDAFFLHAFLRAYALAAAKSNHLEQARLFHQLMAGVVDELELHAGYAEKLGIDLSQAEPCPATSAYTNFLLRIAWHGSLGEIVAAMVPCLRLYTFLGNELSGFLRPEHPYEDWIKTYASDAFRALARQLESLLDKVAVDAPGVRDAYRYAMQCELDFFSAAMEGPQ